MTWAQLVIGVVLFALVAWLLVRAGRVRPRHDPFAPPEHDVEPDDPRDLPPR